MPAWPLRMLACAHLHDARQKVPVRGPEGCLLFDADGLDLNEASRVGRLEATELVHGGLLLVVQTLHRTISHCGHLPSPEYVPRWTSGP